MDYRIIKEINKNTQLIYEAMSLMKKYHFLALLTTYIGQRVRIRDIYAIEKTTLEELINIFQEEFQKTETFREKLLIEIEQNTQDIQDIQDSLDYLCNSREDLVEISKKFNNFDYSILNGQADPDRKEENIKDSYLYKYSVKETKEHFYTLLKKSVNEQEFIFYKNKIEQLEKSRISNTIKAHYNIYEEHLNNDDDFDNFIYYLNYLDYKQKFERETLLSHKIFYQKQNLINREIIINKYNSLKDFLSQKGSKYNLSKSQIENLPISIIGNSLYELIFLTKSEDKLEILIDFLQLYTMIEKESGKNDFPISLTIKLGKKQKMEFNSEQIRHYIINSLKDIAYLNKDKYIDSKTIKTEIKNIETYKKKSLHICIRKIAYQLINHDIMTKVSNKGNKYELYSPQGKLLELRRIDAELIYDIAEAIGLEVKKIKGSEKGMKVLYYDKMDVIKERLETAAKIKEYDLPSYKENFIDLNY